MSIDSHFFFLFVARSRVSFFCYRRRHRSRISCHLVRAISAVGYSCGRVARNRRSSRHVSNMPKIRRGLKRWRIFPTPLNCNARARACVRNREFLTRDRSLALARLRGGAGQSASRASRDGAARARVGIQDSRRGKSRLVGRRERGASLPVRPLASRATPSTGHTTPRRYPQFHHGSEILRESVWLKKKSARSRDSLPTGYTASYGKWHPE